MFKFNKYSRVLFRPLRIESILQKLTTNKPVFIHRNFHIPSRFHLEFKGVDEENEYYKNLVTSSPSQQYNFNDENNIFGSEDNPFIVTFTKKHFLLRIVIAGLVFGVVLFCYLIITHDENVYKQLIGVGSSSSKDGGSSFARQIIGKKPIPIKRTDVTFDDVKGIDESKAELEEIVEFLKDPKKFERLGGRIPKGVLLHGKTGTGKTLLAKAVAGESHRPFFYTCGSSFEEVFVGVGSKRIRELFAQAKKFAPCIIFIDEIDSIAGKRSGGDPKWSRQGLNQLLNEMDGFGETNGIVVIAATNFLKALDSAVLRPGRFDKIVYVPVPDLKGRFEMLKLFFKKIPLSEKIDLMRVSRGLIGLTGADLSNIANQSAIRASKMGRSEVYSEDIYYAVDRQIMGLERRSRQAREKELYKVAIHESGHAFVSYLQKQGNLEIHKITVIPRGDALGYTALMPKEGENRQVSKKELVENIRVNLGGRIAEEIFFGEDDVSGKKKKLFKFLAGAVGDLQKASFIAREMVQSLGMSNRLGMINYNNRGDLSEETKREIDLEIREIINKARKETMDTLKRNKKKIQTVAELLMKYETISGKEFNEFVENGKIPTRNVE